MNRTLDDAERGDLRHCISGSSTLNNSPNATPQRSRRSSIDGKERSGTEPTIDFTKASIRTQDPFLYQELEMKWMGSVIITCFFISGLVDAVSFNSWNCFVGMQTGNTVFAALGLSGQPGASHRQQYYKSLVAIGSFGLGVSFFNFIHRWPTGLAQAPSSRRRLIFSASFLIQALMIIIAAALVQVGAVSNMPYIAGTFSSGSHRHQTDHNPHYADLVPIAILSFEAAGQVCLSRVLSVIELPTIVVSTLYHDFIADLYSTRQIWMASTSTKDFILARFRRQEKRFFSIVALFCGAVVGGEMYKSSVGMAGAFWVAAGLKLLISISFLIWKEENPASSTVPQ